MAKEIPLKKEVGNRTARQRQSKANFYKDDGFFLIDSHAAFTKLLDCGFTNEQSEAIVDILKDHNQNMLIEQKNIFVKTSQYAEDLNSIQKRINDTFIDIAVLRKGEMVNMNSEIDVILLAYCIKGQHNQN